MHTLLPTPLNVAAAVLRNAEQLVLIARRSPAKSMAGKWEFPGGKIEPNELPQQALQRELYEELGIEVQIGKLLLKTEHQSPLHTICLWVFDVYMPPNTVIAWTTDHDALAWVTPAHLLQYDLADPDVPVAQWIATQ